MNGESKINVHHSSLVSLKAELLKKQAEVEAAKSQLKYVYPAKPSKIKDKRSVEKQKKTKKEKEQSQCEPEDIDTIKTLKKSELMLKAKSRLYDKLTKTHTNMNPNFLVDFEHKPDEPHNSEEERLKGDSEEERLKEDNNHESDYDSDSEWVEYTDCFGRTRKCLREDLKKMKEEDEKLNDKFVRKEDEERKEVFYVEDREPEKEPEIEMMRRKWEEQTAKLANKADIHYQDILFDEARSHGVGYYAFSQDEEERLKQQENLNKLRKETEQMQKENQEIRDTKNKIQQNRLRVARLRQRIRAGLPIDETEEEISSNNSNTSLNPKEDEKKNSLQNEQKEESTDQKEIEGSNAQEDAKKNLENIESKIEAFGELLGKRNKWYIMSQEEWVSKKRKERVNEFAPVYDNFKKGESFQLKSSTEEQIFKENENNSRNSSDSEGSDIIGPLPPTQDESEIIGPIPPLQVESDIIGPLPPTQDASDVIGPMPPSQVKSDIIGPLPPVQDTSNITRLLPTIQDETDIKQSFIPQSFIGPTPILQNQPNIINPITSELDDILIGPVPPPQIYEGESGPATANITTQIEAGLKFLRQKFEKEHT